jgi:hypothetical protein
MLRACGAVLVACASACQLAADFTTRSLDPYPPAECTLPSTTGAAAQVRVVNVVPGKASADFCFRESGTADWGQAVLRNSGTADGSTCWDGLPYASATVPFGVRFKKVDIKAIPAGGPCSQAATSEANGVSLGQGVTTIVRIGGGSAKVSERLAAFPEDTANPDPIDLRIRVINALPGGPDLQIGTATIQGTNISLPATASLILVTRPVAFGSVESPGPTVPPGYKVDAQGYMTFDTLGTGFVLVPANQVQAIVAWYQPPGAYTKTMYAVGDPGDLSYPVRGLYCDDASPDASNAALAACTLTSLPTLAVETFNVGLYGAGSPNETARKAVIFPELANDSDPPDLGCYAATAEPDTNQEMVSSLAAAGLKYVVNPQPQMTTPATDPTDWSGHTPPATLPNPPCGGSVPQSIFAQAYSCGLLHCNTSPMDPTGVVQGGTACLTMNCLPELANMVMYPWCVNCFAANTGSLQTYLTTQQNCTQNTAYPLAAAGANTTILASRFPFATNPDGTPATDVFYLPSSYERRSILHARVLLNPQDKSNTVDFFCAYLQTPLLLATLPYPGLYSNGTMYPDMPTPGTNGWRDEQNLQAKRAIAWVQKIAGTGPAIIAGDWHASAHWPTKNSMDGGPLSVPSMAMPWSIGDQSPEVLQQFTGAGFTAAHLSGWNYPCTFCPSANAGSGTPNPYNPTPQTMWVEGYDFNTTFVSGMDFGSVTDEEVRFTQDSVVYDPSKPNGPLSEFYGRRVRVIRPQSSR